MIKRIIYVIGFMPSFFLAFILWIVNGTQVIKTLEKFENWCDN